MLIELFSEERLKTYGLGTVDDSLVLKRYSWNLELSQSLYSSLSLLEVALRNRIDFSFSKHYGPQWLNEQWPYWVKTSWMKKSGAPNPEQDAISKVKERLVRENGEWTRPKLIAELGFGFWTNLFKSYYHEDIWQRKGKPIKDIFQESPKMSTKQAYEQLSRIKKLRNRIAHHEAIWNKSTLYEDHQIVFQLLGGIGEPLKSMANELDRFPVVWTHNPG